MKLKDKTKDIFDVENVDANMNVDMAKLPPCQLALRQHTKRTNFQVAIWKRGKEQFPSEPSPSDGHGWINIDGVLQPLWAEDKENIFPFQIADFIDTCDDDNKSDDVDFLDKTSNDDFVDSLS